MTWTWSPEQIIICALIAYLAAKELLHRVEARVWAKEREKLLNRVQAGTLADYAAYKGIVEPENPEKPESGKVPGGEEYPAAFLDSGAGDVEFSPTRIASAQAAADKVLGG